jgi:hypothetical protein
VNACPLLNNPRYIFIVRRLSILSKLDSNNPYCICAELYFLNLNYLIILDTWPIQPSRRRTGADLYVNRIQLLGPSCSRPTFWFSQIMAITHAPLVSAIIILKPPFLISVASPLRSLSLNTHATFIYTRCDLSISDSMETVTVSIHIPFSLYLIPHRRTMHPSPSSSR